LDAVTNSRWKALVYGDYEYVMPLPTRMKFFIPYVFQPFITQQLGILGKNECPEDIISTFYAAIPKKYVVVQLNSLNTMPTIPGFSVTRRQNHVVDLSKGYDALAKNYNRNTHRNIKAAKEHNLEVRTDVSVLDFLDFQSQWEPGNFTLPNQCYVKRLVLNAETNADITLAGVYDGQNLIAAGLFIGNRHRVYFLLCSSSNVGKEKRAMFFLIDQIIQCYAGQPKVFDFTGSSIKSIEQRNLGFGAEVEYFSFVNRDSFLTRNRY
jgi:hypothetical protein